MKKEIHVGYPGQGYNNPMGTPGQRPPAGQYPPAVQPGPGGTPAATWPGPPHGGVPYQQQPFSGYHAPGQMPGPGPRNRTPWIIGGVALVIVVMVAIGAALFAGGGFGSSDAYTVNGVDNACDLVDPSPLNRWEDQRKTNEHTETAANGNLGGSLSCLIRNQNAYDVAELSVTATLSSQYAEENYRTGKTLAQISAEVVEIANVGQQAYFTSDSDHCHRSADGSCLEYTIGVLDNVLNLQIRLLVEVGDGRAISDSEVADVARVYAERMMASLRK